MFTGIIEEMGKIKEIRKTAKDYEVVITAHKILTDVQLGDSISVNGICLTVTSFTATSFQVDVMPETIKASNLDRLQVGSSVNLERAMAANGRFGGHFVSGHIDTVGEIVERKHVSNASYFWIKTKPEMLKYIVSKGSITIDGISLTVVETKDDMFSISIIPHTLSETVLGERQAGDQVNVECDMLAKYMDRLLEARLSGTGTKGSQSTSSLTMEHLMENGFV
ncbi:riboflavin synthase [Bacillus horti]|uniref:Riboflavin synthase n=1 Tax=Caldalkalibacillus horti TaxID=77523 RepID=A0ABT9VUJ8_9BACI|nr:riboflavin synthase [Bacillus horti]MDQ0164554.1 riboflavin synthase [Bacillus horti]